MAISYIGQASGTNTATLPTHQSGDLILIWAYRDGSTTAPTVPGGFTSIGSAGANNNSEVTAYKIAASGSETVGTWTNATALIALVYRGVDSSDPIGHTLSNGNTATNLIGYFGLTLEVTSGTSWVVAFGGHRNVDTDFEQAISTLTLRTNYVDGVCEAVAHDSNGGVSSWSSNRVLTLTTGTNGSYRTRTLELREGSSALTVSPTGIASALALGSPTITTGAVDVSATGIASTLAIGQPTVSPDASNVSATGIASTLALGEPTVTQGGVTIDATGIASTLALGEPTITVGDVSVSPTGIAWTTAIGEPTITSGLLVEPTGIASTLAIGQPTVTTGEVTASATGIASTLAIGQPTVTTGEITVSVTGIASTLAIGQPTVTVTAPTIEVTGIASTLALGQPTITTGAVTVSPTGISSTSAVGQPSVIPAGAAQNITLTGIASTLGFGQPTVAIVVDTALVARSTTTLEEALYHYLTDPIAYTGHAEKPFKRVKTLDGVTMRNRNDARSELQSRIGGRVYLDRRPADAGDAPAIVIQWTNGNHDYGLAGETDGTEGYLKLTVYAGGQDAARKGGTVYGLLQACLSGYNAGYWGDVLIGEATIDTGRSLAYSPRDASDQWTFTRDMNLIVYYYSASVPEYSDWPLTAIPSIEVMSTQLILSLGDSLIPQGDTLYNVVWLIQPTVGDPVITSFGGDPDKLVSTPGVSGCNRQAVVDRTVYTTIPDTPYITLILTDSSGGQHSKGVQVDG